VLTLRTSNTLYYITMEKHHEHRNISTPARYRSENTIAVRVFDTSGGGQLLNPVSPKKYDQSRRDKEDEQFNQHGMQIEACPICRAAIIADTRQQTT